jgi:hypothetical protein
MKRKRPNWPMNVDGLLYHRDDVVNIIRRDRELMEVVKEAAGKASAALGKMEEAPDVRLDEGVQEGAGVRVAEVVVPAND